MNIESKHLKISILLTALLVICTIALMSCKKKPEPAAPEETKEISVAAVQQKICPVMAGPIDKDIYTDYKGRRVYFCCQACKTEFEKDPQEYVSKLPQFTE